MIFRWVHIVCGIPILGYIYDSPTDTSNYAWAIRGVFLPVLLISGSWVWKGHIVRRLFSKDQPGKLSRIAPSRRERVSRR